MKSTAVIQNSAILQRWYLCAIWQDTKPSSPELMEIAKAALKSCDWLYQNDPDSGAKFRSLVHSAVFHSFMLNQRLASGDTEAARKLLLNQLDFISLAIENYDNGPNGITEADLLWCFGTSSTFASQIFDRWTAWKFTPDEVKRVAQLLDQWTLLAGKVDTRFPSNLNLSLSICQAYDWANVLSRKIGDARKTMNYARAAVSKFQKHAKDFEKEPYQKAWGLAGSSGATTSIALVLGGSPQGYKWIKSEQEDGLDVLGFHKTATRQAEEALKIVLETPNKQGIDWIPGKLDVAVTNYVNTLVSVKGNDAEILRVLALKRDLFGRVFEASRTGSKAYAWAYAGNDWLTNIWNSSKGGLPEAEKISRTMLESMNQIAVKAKNDVFYQLAYSEALQGLATTLYYEARLPERADERTKLLKDRIDTLLSAEAPSRLAWNYAKVSNPELVGQAKSEMKWIAEALLGTPESESLDARQKQHWEFILKEVSVE